MTYLRFAASSLPGQVGRDFANGCRQSDGRDGHITYGPYFSAEPASYTAGFYIRRTGPVVAQSFAMDVCAGGLDVLAERPVRHGDLFDDMFMLVPIKFDLTIPTNLIEVRLLISAAITIEIQSLVIFSDVHRSWGGL